MRYGLRAGWPVAAALGLCLAGTAAHAQVRGSDLLGWCQGALSTGPTALSDAFQCTIYLQAILDQPRPEPPDFERCLGNPQPSATDLMAGILPALEELSASDPTALRRNANEIVADWIAERCATDVAAGQPDVAEPDDTALADGTPAEPDVAATTPDEPAVPDTTDVTGTDPEEPDVVPPDETAATDVTPAGPDVATTTQDEPVVPEATDGTATDGAEPDIVPPVDTAATDGAPVEPDVATITPDESAATDAADAAVTDEQSDIVPPNGTAATNPEPPEPGPHVAVVVPEPPGPEPDVAVVVPDPPVAPADPGVTECDRLAAMPFDPAAVAPGVETGAIDAAAATEACESAVAKYPEIARFRLQLGRALDLAGEPEEAVTLYRPMAEGGYAAAQALMGTLYQTGRGVPEDLAEAVRWHRLAADQGNVVAQTFVGIAYAFGDSGLPQDGAEAARLLQDAAERGYATGQAALGFLYAEGLGVPKDEAQAAIWFARAIAGGDEARATGFLRQLPRPARVRGIQRLLTSLGYDAGPEDGQPGGRTRTAAEAFQAARGLPVTGSVDDGLLIELARAERG